MPHNPHEGDARFKPNGIGTGQFFLGERPVPIEAISAAGDTRWITVSGAELRITSAGPAEEHQLVFKDDRAEVWLPDSDIPIRIDALGMDNGTFVTAPTDGVLFCSIPDPRQAKIYDSMVYPPTVEYPDDTRMFYQPLANTDYSHNDPYHSQVHLPEGLERQFGASRFTVYDTANNKHYLCQLPVEVDNQSGKPDSIVILEIENPQMPFLSSGGLINPDDMRTDRVDLNESRKGKVTIFQGLAQNRNSNGPLRVHLKGHSLQLFVDPRRRQRNMPGTFDIYATVVSPDDQIRLTETAPVKRYRKNGPDVKYWVPTDSPTVPLLEDIAPGGSILSGADAWITDAFDKPIQMRNANTIQKPFIYRVVTEEIPGIYSLETVLVYMELIFEYRDVLDRVEITTRSWIERV